METSLLEICWVWMLISICDKWISNNAHHIYTQVLFDFLRTSVNQPLKQLFCGCRGRLEHKKWGQSDFGLATYEILNESFKSVSIYKSHVSLVVINKIWNKGKIIYVRFKNWHIFTKISNQSNNWFWPYESKLISWDFFSLKHTFQQKHYFLLWMVSIATIQIIK